MPRDIVTRRIGQGPRMLAWVLPPLSVVAGSALALLPIVTQTGWFPDCGLLMLLAWRLLRSDVWPSWWGAPLGLANDLLTGAPIGLSVSVWTAALLLLDLLEQRTMWRDYWIEWVLAAVLVGLSELASWKIDALMGAPAPYTEVVPQVILAILLFPVAARLVSALDRWRLVH